MAQKILSIYIGEHHIRIAELQKGSKKNLVVTKMADAETPADSMQDGMVADVDKIAETLKGCMNEMGTKAKSVIFTVSSKKISSKEIDIPYIKQKEKINELLAVNPQDYFPMSNTEDYLYSHNRLQTLQAESGSKQLRIMAVAMPKVMVESYYLLAEKLGLRVEAIDNTGNSILQLMKRNLTAENNLLVQIEDDISYVSIVIDGVVVLQRSISYGYKMALSALAEVRGITEARAEIIFKENQAGITEKEYEEIAFPLLNGISRFIDFYTSRNKAITIQTINLFSTGGVNMQIGGILQNAIGGEAVYVTELHGITFGKGVIAGNKEMFRYMSCIGAAVDPLSFRLVKEEEQEDKETRTKKTLMRVLITVSIVVGVSVIGTIVFYFITWNQRNELVAGIKEVESITEIVASYEAAQTEYETLLGFYEFTQNDNEKLYDFILDLEELMPESMGFTNFQSSSGVISISGEARGKEPIAELIIQLKALPYIDDVFVTNISETFDEFDVPLTTFSFSCTMKDGDVEEADGEVNVDGTEEITETEGAVDEAE